MRLLLILSACATLGACGTPDVTCDNPSPYQQAVSGKRVQVPSDLDDLEPEKEVPLPDTSPTKPRPENAPCLEQPPKLSSGN